MEENLYAAEQQDLFDNNVIYEQASSGQRFVNWFVDNLLLRIVVQFITAQFLVDILLNVAPEFLFEHFGNGISLVGFLVSYLFTIVHYLFYYTICEKAFKGYTLGKLFSGTRAIRTDGKELTMKDVILRSLSRMVPLEVFSGLGSQCEPWHDTWTKTTVVKSR